jgi:hypothetical protein
MKEPWTRGRIDKKAETDKTDMTRQESKRTSNSQEGNRALTISKRPTGQALAKRATEH